jgi:hypothetical protein
VLQTKQGAMIFYPFGSSKTYTMTGQLNNGTYSPAIAYSGTNEGYNLVPNPYPSAIDWNAGSGWTKTKISGTIWGFSATAKNYGTWNGSVSINSVTNIIPMGQAFFVHATGSSPLFTMTNAVRLHDPKIFLKSGTSVPNVLHLIVSGNSGQDEIAIQFMQDATNASGDTYDALKFYSSTAVPQLCSFTSNDDLPLSINGLPMSDETLVVPLRFNMEYTGEVTFTASGMESFGIGKSIQLEDQMLDKTIDLRVNPVYIFDHQAANDPLRFRLHFAGAFGISQQPVEKQSNVYISGNDIYISYKPIANIKQTAEIFTVLGQRIGQYHLSGTGSDKILMEQSSPGIYLVRLTLAAGMETHEIIVR